MVDSDVSVGGLDARNLLVPGFTESQADQAQMEHEDDMTREGARIKHESKRSQAQVPSAASGAAARMPPPAAAAAGATARMPPPAAAASGAAAQSVGGSAVIVIDDDVIVIDDDDDNDDTAVAQSPSSPKLGAKRARAMRLEELGRTSFADQWAVQNDSKKILAPPRSQAGEAGNADSNDGWIQDDSQDIDTNSQAMVASSVQAVEADSQGIMAPPSPQDDSESNLHSDVRVVWKSTNTDNEAAATAQDANDVPIFGHSGNGGNGVGRSFEVQADGSALRTDTYTNGTKRTSTWIKTAHGQWEKHDKDSV
jgi:hypothetical protein